MRFSFLSLRHDPNGTSRLHVDLMNDLIERGHEVFYALPFYLVDKPFWTPCLAEKVNAMRLPRMGGFDAIFFSHHDLYTPGFPLTPLVNACDAIRRFFILRSFLPGHLAIAADPAIEKIATSRWLHEQVSFYAGSGSHDPRRPHVHPIYGGVNLGRFRPPAQPRRVQHPPRILFRDTIDTIKGSASIRYALDILRQRGLNFEPLTLGGTEPQVLRQYQQADIFVSAEVDWGLGWSASVAEAMACGCAVVCTDTPAVDLLAKDGVTALLVRPGDSESLANAIEQLILDPDLRTAIASAAAELACRFSIDRMTDEILRIMKNEE
ncbi:MAG TPA: glycosyltransferase family 4 protein [Planctomycetota bacterium]|nr:glycosyltransferase family 4 protein [Planctomycetota bacterium]